MRIVSIASRTFLFSSCVYLDKYYNFIRKSFLGSEAKDLENYYSKFYVLLGVAVKVSLGVLGPLPDLFCHLRYPRGKATWGRSLICPTVRKTISISRHIKGKETSKLVNLYGSTLQRRFLIS